ncbi:MAG: type IX secretion system membrane protein PorP/SprF [Bacteroidota bacterium]
MKTKIITIAAFLITITAFGQQNAQYNHYIFNQLVINPAYAGTKGMINVNGIYSSQWSGLDGAPTTQTLSIEGPAIGNVGAGLHIIRDNIGAQSQTGVYGNYAYKFIVHRKLMLSLGIATGVTHYTLDGSLLYGDDQYDPAVPMGMESVTRFDSKFGAFLYSKKFYVGFSVSDLTADVKSSYDQLVAGQVQHYYLTSGYVFDLTPDVKFKPGFLIKEDFRAPTNIDINAFFLYKNKFWLGGTFRTGAGIFNGKDLDASLRTRDALVVMTDINITDNLRLGYAYTFSMTALNDYPGHEISLGYYFDPSKKTKMLTPRYF